MCVLNKLKHQMKQLRRLKFIALLCLSLLSITAKGQQCSENTNVNGIAGTGHSSGNNIGQSFTACKSGRLASVSAVSGNAPSGFNKVIVQIYSGEGFQGSALLTSAEIQINANRTVTWNLSSHNLQVVEGQKYTARFSLVRGNAQLKYGTGANANIDYYSRGRIIGVGQSHHDMFFSARIDIITTTLTPLDQSTDISRNSPIQVNFSRNMTALSGEVYVRDVVADLRDTVQVEDLVIDGSLVTIPREGILKTSTQYEVLIPSTALESTDGLKFDGFSTGDWTFTTGTNVVSTITSVEAPITNVSPTPFDMSFSEAVTGFDMSDLVVTNGTPSNFTGSGTDYSVDITPGGEGDVMLKIPTGVTVEGNDSTELVIEYDITNPTVAITSSTSGVTTMSPVDLTITFSNQVTDFESADLILSNAVVTKFDTISNAEYRASIDVIAEGAVTVDIPASSALDSAGNGNDVSSQFAFDYEIDLEDGLISYYPLNDIKFDVRGNNPDLTDFGGTPIATTDHHGQNNGAYSLTSSILANTQFDNSDINGGFSISTWIRPLSDMGVISAKKVIYDNGTSSTIFYEASALRVEFNGNQFSLPIELPASDWAHIALSVTLEGSVVLYVDNVAHNLGATPTSIITSTGNFILGGTANLGSIMDGDIDEFRYYGKALHPLEVAELFSKEEYLLRNDIVEICANDSFTAADGSVYTEDGNYSYIEPSGDATPNTFVSLTLNTIPFPAVIATADNLIVCEGNEVILTGTGADTYVWDNGAIDGEAFMPTATTTYTVIGTATNGCENTSQVTIQLVPRGFDDETITTTAPEFCPDGSPFSATISTGSSTVGVNYFLRSSVDNTVLDGPIAGTGTALNFNAGTLTETSTFNVLGEKPATLINSTLDFDGSNDKLTTTFIPTATTELTVEGWVFPRSTNYDRIISSYAGAGAVLAGDFVLDTYNVSANNGRALRVFLGGPGNASENFSIANVLTSNAWNHFAVTFDNGVVKIYVDGIEVGQTTFNFTSIPPTSVPLHIGEDRGGSNAEFFNGQMDEIRVWNTARTVSQLNENKDLCLTGTETGLAAYFNFDDGTGTTVTDLVNGANGTLTNMDAATDWTASGNGLSCLDYFVCSYEMSQEITIGDVTAPTIAIQDITVQLDSNGSFILTGNDIDNGTTDNCTAVEDLVFALDQITFGCDDIGTHPVQVTISDLGGNTSNGSVNVTVEGFIEDQTVSIADNALCPGTAGGTTVSLANSQVGVDYYLRNSTDDSIIEGPVAGTGSALDLSTGILNVSTTFNVMGQTNAPTTSLEFEGNNQFVSAAEDLDFLYQNGYSVEALINLDAPGTVGSRPIVTYGTATSSDIEIYVQGTTNKLLVLHGRTTSAAITYYVYPSPPFGQWAHLAVTYDGGLNELKVYYDGIEQTIETAINPTGLITKRAGSALAIGRARIFNGTNNSFVGKIDEVRIWDTPRLEAEIVSNMGSCLEGNESGLISYYKFDDASGSEAIDLAGGNTGTLNGMDGATDWVEGAVISCSTSSCLFEMTTEVSITVEDSESPIALIQDLTIQLANSGSISITPQMVDNGSSDNCTSAENLILSLDKTDFDTEDLGENTVTLTVSDQNGNTATETSVVTITSPIEDRTVSTVSNTICPDTETIISLSNSQADINYYLRDESNTIIDGPTLGTGTDIDFNTGAIATPTTFNVFAETLPIEDDAFNMAGTGYVSVPSSTSLRLDHNWTIEAWINPSAGDVNIVETYDGNGGFILRTTSGGTLQAFAMQSSSVYSLVSSRNTITNGQWTHVAATFNEDTNELKVYINGGLNNTNATAFADQRGSSIPIKLGARGDDSQIAGSHIQDEIRIWNVERSAQEISNNRQSTLLGNEQGLVAYYDYNDLSFVAAGTTVEDKSSNANDGVTVGNFSTSNIVTGALPASTDKYGIQMSITQVITPEDTTLPTVLTQDLSLILDSNGAVTISVDDIDNGSSDNCTSTESLTRSLDITTFDINDLGENTVTLTVTDGNGNTSTGTATVGISDKQEQVITFDAIADKTFGAADFSITASSNSQLPITFSVIEGNITINNDLVTIVGTGSATIRASQAGDDTYAPALLDLTFNIAKADQTLTVEAINDKSITAPDFTVIATIDTGLDLDYTISGPATIVDNMVSLDGTVGTVTVTVTQSGNDNYNSISSDVSFDVVELTPQIVTFTGIADKAFGDANFDITASIDSSLPVSFTVISGGVSIVESGVGTTGGGSAEISITGAGTAIIRASNSGNETYAPLQEDITLNIAKADQALTVSSIDNRSILAPDFEVQATINTGFDLEYSVSGPATTSGNTVSLNGTVGTVTVTVSQAGNDNYNAVTMDVSFDVVDLITQAVTFTGVSDKTFGGANFDISASLDSGLPVTFTVISGGVSITASTVGNEGGGQATFMINAAGPVVVQASNTGNETYAPLQEDITFNIAKADQVITIDAVNTQSTASGPITINATVDTGLSLDYTVTGPATLSGNIATLDGSEGTVDVTVSQVGNDNYNEATNSISFDVVAKQVQTITFNDISDLIYGAGDETLSATASSNLAVTFSVISGPATVNGSTLAITGIGNITVEANQAGNDEFLEASEQQTFTVSAAELTVTADDQTITYGDAIPTLTYAFSGFVNGEGEADLNATVNISTTASDDDGLPNAGTYPIAITVVRSEAGDNYTFTVVDGTLTINKADQTISIDPIDDKELTDAAFDVVASVDSGLDLVYEVDGPATISGTTITLDGTPGTVTVTVSQAGDVNHNVASESITFDVQAVLSVTNGLEDALKVYPNPVVDYLVIDTKEVVDVSLFGMDGSLVREFKQTNGVIDVSDLKAGIFLLKVSGKDDQVTLRIFKQ